jgi:SAM-dependent methyltransferase
MSADDWYRSIFGDDYLEIYQDALPPERTAAEVEGIVALLGLQPGARVLDVACGHGRHAIPLAGRGMAVTGFDLSRVFLDKASADAKAAGVDARWVHGDMRRLPFDSEFDAAINVFTAFGYFDDPADDLAVLRGVHSALRPGGSFLLETLHRDGLSGRFQRNGFDRLRDGTLVLRERRWDLARDVIDEDILIIRPDGSRREYRTAVRMHSLDELIALMREAGLEPVRWFGGLGGAELGLQSRRLVLISRRDG